MARPASRPAVPSVDEIWLVEQGWCLAKSLTADRPSTIFGICKSNEFDMIGQEGRFSAVTRDSDRPESPPRRETRCLMFAFLARLIERRSWLVVLAWVALTFFLFRAAPPWDQVTKDDDVRFFPRNFPSVIGQDLLERGFPGDAASP